MANQPHIKRSAKEDDVAFLADEFEMSPRAAAELVADNSDAVEHLAAAEARRQRDADPLETVPVPKPGKADDYPVPAFESIKPLSVENDRTGAG